MASGAARCVIIGTPDAHTKWGGLQRSRVSLPRWLARKGGESFRRAGGVGLWCWSQWRARPIPPPPPPPPPPLSPPSRYNLPRRGRGGRFKPHAQPPKGEQRLVLGAVLVPRKCPVRRPSSPSMPPGDDATGSHTRGGGWRRPTEPPPARSRFVSTCRRPGLTSRPGPAFRMRWAGPLGEVLGHGKHVESLRLRKRCPVAQAGG